MSLFNLLSLFVQLIVVIVAERMHAITLDTAIVCFTVLIAAMAIRSEISINRKSTVTIK